MGGDGLEPPTPLYATVRRVERQPRSQGPQAPASAGATSALRSHGPREHLHHADRTSNAVPPVFSRRSALREVPDAAGKSVLDATSAEGGGAADDYVSAPDPSEKAAQQSLADRRRHSVRSARRPWRVGDR